MQAYICEDFRHQEEPTLLVCVRGLGPKSKSFHCWLTPRRSDIPREGIPIADDYTVLSKNVCPCTTGVCVGLKVFPGTRHKPLLTPLPLTRELESEILRACNIHP